MKIRLHAIAAALACCASAAMAQGMPPTTVLLSPTGNGTAGATFTQYVSGLFVDYFVFAPNTISGTATVTLTPLSGPVTFFSALLNDTAVGAPAENGMTNLGAQSMVTSGMPIMLTVFGYSGDVNAFMPAAGSYTVAISVAVPEPAGYALMMAGLGLMGTWRVWRQHQTA